MTTPVIGAGPSAVLRAALQLYPARYRHERGEELAEVFADTTAAGGRPAVAREALGLAAYGLRVRLGLTGASAAGRLLALVAPMLAGAAAGAMLVAWLTTADRIAVHLSWDDSYGVYFSSFCPPVAAALLAVAALLGRWTAVRVSALVLGAMGMYDLAYAAWNSSFDVWWSGYIGMASLPFVVAAVLLVAAPTDLLPRPTWRTAGLVLASIAVGGLLAAAQSWDDTTFPLDRQWFVLMLIAPLLLTFAGLRGRFAPMAVGVAALVLAGPGCLFNIWRGSGGLSHLLPMAAPTVAALVLVAVAVHRFGRRETVPEVHAAA
ncbi:hypothetical protein [Streptomyces sp. CBMA156]|uniref:hypothetical protein n=1 Tax=Streptomyces sp. CBMA156 TaxID=1930280 RepID=UPI001661AB47|nr:hypothetical protein [Streptomyces sp. CBMA156]MBD0672230.1 hypothetical protein [Streptomyces sp. CBMA156]